MATSPGKRAALAGVAALGLAAAAVAQERPESLLPPGFGEAAPAAPSAPAPTPAPTGGAPAAAPRVQAVSPAGPLPPLPPLPFPSPTASPTPRYVLPAFARRSLTAVGAADGFAREAFGAADGRYVERLMRYLSAPLPSRWLSISLRRLLVAQVETPARVNGADFAAERAWLLLRMGESVSARAVAQAVDSDRVTPKLRDVWMQAALASADPAGLCPLAEGAGDAARAWIVARAMCAGLTGSARTQPLVVDIRRRRIASGIDLRLAQKVMGAGLNSRQAVTIEWAPVSQLTTWRFGLATATGVVVPDELYATVGPQVRGWQALAPAIPLAERAAVADQAAAMGVLSSAALVDMYAALADGGDAPAALANTAATLRDAYVGNDRATRIAALAKLWDAAETPATRHARLVLTARAAARLPAAANEPQADRMIASMLTAGLDRSAQRWQGSVPGGSDGWAMLLLADPDALAQLPASVVTDYAPSGGLAARKRQMFFAGMAGLGRLPGGAIDDLAEQLGVPVAAQNSWTRAIDAAAGDGQPGTVLLLAAVGMQADDWAHVSPAALFHIVAALRAVGLDGEARMIAAEAIARL
ncbi:hypothetical protein ASE95_02995 [Sphingomonas sp. Leaf231]|uniref:hypothetical protein n=1 Tax=Sphingomonas sp. Leaf231 TaxID=1736301 RepID=UPI0006FCD85B|nr:hypothetical protein [Sphingomonas sp. Leaf231]KQN93884.1 hypothetical protein ASE95_02995 [Sphingomonas sp. Leaf231]